MREWDISQYYEVGRLLGDGAYGEDDLQHYPLLLRDVLSLNWVSLAKGGGSTSLSK